MRSERDATLTALRLLLPSIQVNIRAGKFPPKEANGVRYLVIPVKLKGGSHGQIMFLFEGCVTALKAEPANRNGLFIATAAGDRK